MVKVVRLASCTIVFFAVGFLFLSVVLVDPFGASSAREVESQFESDVTLEAESMLNITAESKREPDSIVDPFTTFTVLPREVAAKVGDTFFVEVSVANVSDMYAWQVHLFFDNAILECVDVSLPHDYVFSYAYTVGDALIDYNSTEFENPLQLKIRNDEGWILVGDCLLGSDQPNFNGSGSLCKIEFKAISSGSSTLMLSIDPTSFGTYYVSPAPSFESGTPIVSNGEVFVSSEE